MKFILILSNIISLIVGSIVTFLLIFYYLSDDFQKTYIDILKFIIMPFIALSIGFYQWKKVLLHKNFAEKQFDTIVKLMDELKKVAFFINIKSTNRKSFSVVKFDRKESSHMNDDLNVKIFFTDLDNNMYVNTLERLQPIINDVFLPLDIARAFNKLEFSVYTQVNTKDLPESYAYIGKRNENDEVLFIPDKEDVITLGNLIEAKNDIFNQIENWLKENSVNKKLNTEYNRYNKD